MCMVSDCVQVLCDRVWCCVIEWSYMIWCGCYVLGCRCRLFGVGSR